MNVSRSGAFIILIFLFLLFDIYYISKFELGCNHDSILSLSCIAMSKSCIVISES